MISNEKKKSSQYRLEYVATYGKQYSKFERNAEIDTIMYPIAVCKKRYEITW